MTAEAKNQWDPRFFERSAIFAPVAAIARQHFLSFGRWPTLMDFQAFLDKRRPAPRSLAGPPLRVVPQANHAHRFEDHYEPRIYLRGELQTRCENWHDFFQILVWVLFPDTKATLNAMHHAAMRERIVVEHSAVRNARENALTQFDECGAAVLCSDQELLSLLATHQWRSLFCSRRQEVRRKLRCIVFGHATYEKALTPYVGLTAHAVLVEVEQAVIDSPYETLLPQLDARLNTRFAEMSADLTPRSFSPVPLLGIPGWWPANEDPAFYANTEYFRPLRRQQST